MKKSQVIPLQKESYLAVIRNSVGTHMFRTFYAFVDEKKQDIIGRGDLSCAFFVSFVLAGFSLIKSMHGTVDGTVRDMESSGWKYIKTPKPGCIIVWEPRVDKQGELHKHIGFYIGEEKAISNDSKKGSPRVHSYNFRKVSKLYWNSKLT
jgi:hypothetical protein